MGRGMHGDQAYAYRAVITETTVDGPQRAERHRRDEPRVFVYHAGPFATPGAAKAAVTRAERNASGRSRRGYEAVWVTAAYERAPLVWETVA